MGKMGNECGREGATATKMAEDSQSYVFESSERHGSTSDELAEKETLQTSHFVKAMTHIQAAATTVAVPAAETAQRVVAQVTEARQTARDKATASTDRVK